MLEPGGRSLRDTSEGNSTNATIELAALKQQRSALKRSITLMKNKVDREEETCDRTILECRLAILESYFKQISHIQSQIERQDSTDECRSDIEDQYVLVKSQISNLLKTFRDKNDSDTTINNTTSQQAPSRLPTLKLPKFDGKYSDYKRFIAGFKNIVHNEPIPTIDKFNYLLSCLSGPALAVVEAYQVTENNYTKALDRLKERYDNKILIFNDHISSLFNITPIARPDAVGLRNIVDTVSALRGSLSSLGTETDILNSILIHLVMMKVDCETKSKYDENLQFDKFPTWDDCNQVISRRCQFLETQVKPFSSIKNHEAMSANRNKSKSAFLHAKSECLYCHGTGHDIYKCEKFLSLTIQKRFDHIKSSLLCINCLDKGHNASNCMKKSRCRKCQKPHNTLLHFQNNNAQLHTNRVITNPPSSFINDTSTLISRTGNGALLPTAVIFVKDCRNSWQPVRALLDSCSELNFMTTETVKFLKLKSKYTSQQVSGISDIKANITRVVTATIKSRINLFERTTTFFVSNSISSNQPRTQISCRNWKIPTYVELADPNFYKSQRIDLLIGSELFFEMLCEGIISLDPKLPRLVNTTFGWVVGGNLDQKRATKSSSTFTCNVTRRSEPGLDSIVQRFWQIEEFSIKSSNLTLDEQNAEAHFMQNLNKSHDGRLQVRLPFKLSPDVLGNSYEIAKKRFLSLERRFLRDVELKNAYSEFIKEYIDLKHMSLIQNVENNKPHYYIPHHCVLRPESTSTKLRVVFDASASTSSGFSLNQILHIGPTIQPELILTLLAFRLNKYAFIADISKMYRQFLIEKTDRCFQLILWRDEINKKLQTFELNTVTYGMSAAPFLAIRCLKYLAELCEESHPEGAKVIQENFYVDDCLTGAETVSELHEKKSQLIEILGRAGLTLAKWNSNHADLLSEDIEEVPIHIAEEPCTKALGMSWKPNIDTFYFKFKIPKVQTPTKRSILSTVAKIFDVLGLLSPIIVRCKILIQEIWKTNLSWDECLPLELATLWNEIERDFSYINDIEVPRYVFTSAQAHCEMHGFADASQRAYGCSIYVRSTMSNHTNVNLLIAKSKVAPSKVQSIPRLELCAALLLARTWDKIRLKLEKYTKDIYFWTDSTIVLGWLKMPSSSFTCFVANRLSELQELSKDIKWRYVSTKQNPADIVSRGSSALKLPTTIWFSGPDFLVEDKRMWPDIPPIINFKGESTKGELRRALTLHCTKVLSDQDIILNIIENYSSFRRILNITAYIYRVFNGVPVNKTLKLADVEPITHFESEIIFLKIVSVIQYYTWGKEIASGKGDHLFSNNIKGLSPFREEKQLGKNSFTILRVGGRLLNAPIPIDAKFPALLPKDHRFTRLYVTYLHITHLHAGPKALIGILRQRVWVINTRELVRQIVRQCTHCFHYKPRLAQQIMGNLPADRFRAQRPFLVCGIDFCGPFLTSYRIRGKQPYKTYLAVFVCFSSKAVHIELVSDLSSNNFLLCIKRFVGRRGVPQRIYCDNATNFVGANNHLKQFVHQLNPANVSEYSTKTGFKFCFIPPRAPHFGGLWESAVKSAKTLLIKNIAQAYLTFEELQTLVIEVEAILNSRPIAPLSNDPNDGEALTPAHLLIGSSLLATPDQCFDCANVPYLTRYQRVTFLKQQFWDLWRRDYISSLQQRAKWNTIQKNIEVGQLVLMYEDNIPPQQWLLGRISEVFTGRDGKVRVATIKTKKGAFRRAIHKVAPLPF